MKISIVFPSRGICNPAFAHSLANLVPYIGGIFDQYEILYVSGVDVALSRNRLMENAKGDYIFWADDDVLLPADVIPRLFRHDKDFVSGLYFSRRAPHFPQIHKVNKKNKNRYDSIIDYKKDSLIEVDAVGGGCMLIKREVFDKLKKPYFQYTPAGEKTLKKGEDYFFCDKVREAGMKIYCDTSVIGLHIGEMFVGKEHWDIYHKKLKKLEKDMGSKKFKEWKKKQHS